MSLVLEKILADCYPGHNIPLPLWETPQRQEFGDFSTAVALKLASALKKNPLVIAEEIKNELEKEASFAEKISIVKPGFINLFFSRDTLVAGLNRLFQENEGCFSLEKKRKVLIEFVSANPTGPLSIAHGRQAVVGDAIANILGYCGNDVTREYYVNDEGRQIELLVSSVEERIKELGGNQWAIPEGGYQGEYLKEVAAEAIEQKPEDLRDFSLAVLLSWIKKDLARLGIVFDNWVSQKKLIDQGKVEAAFRILEDKGLLYEKEDALWFSSTRFGDDKDRVLRKADGTLTYFASDIAYHENKLERKFDLLINLWGPDHHGYIQRVKAAVRALGLDDKRLAILIIQLVTLTSKEKMSKRKGTAILLSELEQEVGKDAARFYYLTRKNSSHLEFDIDLAKTLSFDNPLYYIQYAHARICSIAKKTDLGWPDPEYSRFLGEEEELVLLRKLFQFSSCLEKAYYSLEPMYVIDFLKELATALHKFYEVKRVLVKETDITRARLNLLAGVKTVLSCGLHLLGIKPLEEM